MTERYGSKTLIFGGEEITVYELPTRPGIEWSEKAEPYALKMDDFRLRREAGNDIPGLVNDYAGMLKSDILAILDLVVERVPEDRREFVDQNATQTEILVAFAQLLGQANSMDFFLALIGAPLTAGESAPQTGTNSVSASGAAGSMS